MSIGKNIKIAGGGNNPEITSSNLDNVIGKNAKLEFTPNQNAINAILELQSKKSTETEILEEHVSLFVAFNVGNEIYTLPIELIHEVVSTPEISTLPQSPDFLLGLVNVRGNVFAVLDLVLKFGLNERNEYVDPKFILVVKSDVFKIAIALENMPITIEVKKREIESADNLSQIETEKRFIKGIIKRDDKILIYLDVLRLVDNLDI